MKKENFPQQCRLILFVQGIKRLFIDLMLTFIYNFIIIPPANEVAGVFSDPYVRPFVRPFVRSSVRPSVPPNL